MNIRDFDLRKVNSATKYPSILTYHAMGERGRLTDEVRVSFENEHEIIVTEKVDGTNARLIVFGNGDYVIGSREELLCASSDLIFNPAQQIVEAVRNLICNPIPLAGHVTVCYGEVYGGKVTAASKGYTANGQLGFRLFDVAQWDGDGFACLTNRSLEEIAAYRENGGTPFLRASAIDAWADDLGIAVVPQLSWFSTLKDCDVVGGSQWLRAVSPSTTLAGMGDGKRGRPEGVVVRTPDRRKIAKLRFDDYERTLKGKR